jgi:hypothetical protein
MEVKLKKCSKCSQEKAHTAFHKMASKPDGLHPYCKVCKKKYDANRYDTQTDHMQATARDWKRRNRARLRAYDTTRALKTKQQIPDFLVSCPIEEQRLISIYNLRDWFTNNTGIVHQVDHMWPICDGGPHWSGNLQILTARDNRIKYTESNTTIKQCIKDSLKEEEIRHERS